MSKYFIKKKNKYYSSFITNNENNVYKAYENILRYLNIDNNVWNNILYRTKNIKSDYVVIAPSASSSFRNLDKAKFREIVKYLSAKTKVYLIGINEQKNLLQYIANDTLNVDILTNLELKKIIEIINYSKLFIGLDSGLSHLALLLNKKIIAIIGGGKYGQFFPYKNSMNVKYLFYQMNCFGCNWNCKFKIPFCIDKVTVDNVIKAYEELNEIP